MQLIEYYTKSEKEWLHEYRMHTQILQVPQGAKTQNVFKKFGSTEYTVP